MILLSTQERRLTFGPTASAWNEASGSASTLSSRAWNRAPPSVRWRRSTLPTIPVTASSGRSDPASRITNFYIRDEVLAPKDAGLLPRAPKPHLIVSAFDASNGKLVW